MNEPREVNQPGEVNKPEMDQLESQLRNALAREDAPEGFEARVRAAAAAQPEPEPRSWWQRFTSDERFPLQWAAPRPAPLAPLPPFQRVLFQSYQHDTGEQAARTQKLSYWPTGRLAADREVRPTGTLLRYSWA